MSEVIIHCKYDELIDPKKLKNHPDNTNKHGQDQIERLGDGLLTGVKQDNG